MTKSEEDQIIAGIDKIMDDYVDRVFQLSQERLVEGNKIDTGTMLKTANVNRKPLEKEIVYPAAYSAEIEFGRNPGQLPNIESLTKWVRRKLRVPAKNAKSVAWAIALSIKKRGTQPFPFIQPSLDQANNEFGFKKVIA